MRDKLRRYASDRRYIEAWTVKESASAEVDSGVYLLPLLNNLVVLAGVA